MDHMTAKMKQLRHPKVNPNIFNGTISDIFVALACIAMGLFIVLVVVLIVKALW